MAPRYAEPGALPGRQNGAVLPPAVELRGVHKQFGSVHAVRGVALTVGSGEVMAFLGPNGAGKTSTIDMILGLSRPTSGAVEVYGMTPRQAVRKGLVSAVMQSGGLLKDLTVAETAQYTASLFAVSRPVGEVLERAGITAIASRAVGKCSGGEQQRLRFAMALIPDPQLLASGRTIRATLPGADEAALRAMPGVDGVEVRGDTVLIHSGDTDAVARQLLNQTPARDLEITSRGLEEAFIALTGDHAADPPGKSQAAL